MSGIQSLVAGNPALGTQELVGVFTVLTFKGIIIISSVVPQRVVPQSASLLWLRQVFHGISFASCRSCASGH